MEDNLFDIEAAREDPGVPALDLPLGVVPNERSIFQLRLEVEMNIGGEIGPK